MPPLLVLWMTERLADLFCTVFEASLELGGFMRLKSYWSLSAGDRSLGYFFMMVLTMGIIGCELRKYKIKVFN